MIGNKIPKIRFEGVSEEWNMRNLGEVLKGLYNGQTPSRANPKFWGGDINWLTSGELNRNIVYDTYEKITPEGQKDANLKVVPTGTVVIAITGLEAAGTRGSCAKLGLDTTLNQSCMALIPDGNSLDSLFLFQWYLKIGDEYGIRYTQGTKQQSYNAELIKKLPINLPCIKEQEMIADFIGRIGDRIALQQRQLERLKYSKQGFLQKMFPKDGKCEPEVRFPGFVKGWQLCKLDEISIINPSSKLPEEFEYVDLESVIGTSLIHHTKKNILNAPSRAQRVARKGDIFYQTVRPYQKNNYLFNLDEDNFVFSTGYAQIRPYCDSYFLITAMQEEGFFCKVLNRCTGTSYPAINSKELSKIDIQIPSNNLEQQKIGEFFKQLDDTIALHEKELDLLKETKKAFLQKMFV